MKNSKSSYQVFGRGLIALVVLLLSQHDASSQAQPRLPLTPGIYFSAEAAYQSSPAQQTKLVASLRRITGWQHLRVEERGHLTLAHDHEDAGGSAWARRVLRAVFRSGHRFVIENHAASRTVNFGQLDEGLKYEDDRSGIKLDIYRVRLDYDDFQQMQAGPEVRAAFDEGFTVLHELLHGLGLDDTHIPNELGECERVINHMRAELGLLLRDQYLGDVLRVSPYFFTMRLRFKSLAAAGQARKRHYLFFALATAPEPKSAPRRNATQSRSDKEKLLASFSE